MKTSVISMMSAVVFGLLSLTAHADHSDRMSISNSADKHHVHPVRTIQLGPRPLFLVDDMDASPLKKKLASCENKPLHKTDFSIGHRGAALQFPEHTRESYMAAARMGAGVIECDVTFTKDKELVCRHSQCDLHTTTNILATPLADKCSSPFTPAQFDADGNLIKPASATCCTSDITLEEFKTLKGKMDGANRKAITVAGYMAGTENFRTDLYAGPSSGTLMTHKESIALFKSLGAKMTPELKTPSIPMPYDSDGDGIAEYSQEDFAQQMVNEYKAAGVPARNVFPQSFLYTDILYWIANEPAFGKQAVYLDPVNSPAEHLFTLAEFETMYNQGVRIIAPPMWTLLAVDSEGHMMPSQYALDAKASGLNIITWTLERSGLLADGDGGYYYQTVPSALNNEGDTYEALDVLGRQIGVLGVFSDWPATVSYYANCMGLK